MNFINICRSWHRTFLWLTLLPVLGCSTAGTPATETAAEPATSSEAASQPEATPMRMTDDAFRSAAYEGKLDVVREGLAAGNYVNAMDAKQHLTPLHMAAFNGHTEVVKLLLERGATLDARDIDGKTPLLHACTGPYAETVEVLIAAGADVNTTEATEAFTPLMMAAGLGQTAVVKVLLANKANKDLLDDDGDSALTHAQNKGHTQIVQLLQQ